MDIAQVVYHSILSKVKANEEKIRLALVDSNIT
jgi:hypothetical protein